MLPGLGGFGGHSEQLEDLQMSDIADGDGLDHVDELDGLVFGDRLGLLLDDEVVHEFLLVGSGEHPIFLLYHLGQLHSLGRLIHLKLNQIYLKSLLILLGLHFLLFFQVLLVVVDVSPRAHAQLHTAVWADLLDVRKELELFLLRRVFVEDLHWLG